MNFRSISFAAIILIILALFLPTVFSAPERSKELSDEPYSVSMSGVITGITKIPVPTKTSIFPAANLADTKASNNLIYVLINSSVATVLQSNLSVYKKDLEYQGYLVELYTNYWTNITSVRTLLQTGYSNGLIGAVLIGDIPIPWYWLEEIAWVGTNETFPIDLYYMDLDGNWSGGTGTQANPFTAHDGNVVPEIWVGRLKTSTAGGDEVSLLKNYFYKAHKYRAANLSLLKRALVYVDDDWYDWADQWSNDMESLYPAANRTLIKDKETTTADDYKNRLTNDYEWISLFAHSGDWYHGFIYNAGSSWSYVYNTDITTINPKSSFYNLFCCHGANYSYGADNGYLGGHYIFGNTYGLTAVGSTKTGGMLNFNDFYTPLGQNKTIGTAFKDWFALNGETGADTDSRRWFYGMTILGDPTLTPRDIFPAYAPENIQLKITGNDANLTWNNSESLDVASYNIYRCTAVDGFNFSQPYANTNKNTYVDINAGESNKTNYYYAIRAIDRNGNTGLPSSTVGKYVMALNKGANFITLPLNCTYKTAGDLANAINNCTSVSYWNVTEQRFITYMKGSAENNFTLESGIGYSLEVATGTDFYTTGVVLNNITVNLKAGWNGIGYLNETATNASTLSAKIENSTCVAYWNSALGRFVSYIVGTNISNFNLTRGNGYFVYVAKDSVWSG